MAWADFDNDGDADLIELTGASKGNLAADQVLRIVEARNGHATTAIRVVTIRAVSR